MQWALARNISEGGMLIELKNPPQIGRTLEVQLPGVPGSLDAPQSATWIGEVRHHMKWNYATDTGNRRFCAVGIRFLDTKSAPDVKDVKAVDPATLH